MRVGVGPPGPKVSLTRVSPKGEHKTSTRPQGVGGYVYTYMIQINVCAILCMSCMRCLICVNFQASGSCADPFFNLVQLIGELMAPRDRNGKSNGSLEVLSGVPAGFIFKCNE